VTVAQTAWPAQCGGNHSHQGHRECILERMAHLPALRTGHSAWLIGIGGAAGLAGGLAWLIKGVTILGVDYQPPLTFEVALPLFGLSLLSVAHLTLQRMRRTVVAALAWLAVVTGLVALVSDLLDKGWDASIAASSCPY